MLIEIGSGQRHVAPVEPIFGTNAELAEWWALGLAARPTLTSVPARASVPNLFLVQLQAKRFYSGLARLLV